MVFGRFRKKKRKRSQKSMQSEIARLEEEESVLDFEISLEETRKRVAKKRRSQSTLGKMRKEAASVVDIVGKGIVRTADTVFGGPPPKANKSPKSNKKSKKKKASKKTKRKKEEDDDFGFLL